MFLCIIGRERRNIGRLIETNHMSKNANTIKWRVAGHLIIPILCLIATLVIIKSDPSRDWQNLWAIVQATWRSLQPTLVTWLLLLGLFYLFTRWMITPSVNRYWRSPEKYGLIMMLFLPGLLWLSAFPIVWYLFIFDGWFELKGAELTLFSVKVMGLLFANGMLYFILSRAVFEIIEETENLYIISAEYKNTTVADYLQEKLTWLRLSAAGPIFYYLFSFTLFTDLAFDYLHITESQSGIISQLFIELVIKGWTIEESVLVQGEWITQSNLNTLGIIYLLGMLAIVLPLRLFLCQLRLWLWERKHQIEV